MLSNSLSIEGAKFVGNTGIDFQTERFQGVSNVAYTDP